MEGLAQVDSELVAALCAGDEAAFARLVDELSPGMLRMARMYVASDAAAEEVVQDTWLGVLKGLDRFEGRSTLKTWIFRILVNVAKTRGVRDARSVPFSSAFDAATAPDEPAVDPDRFLPHDHDRWPAHWAIGPTPLPDDAAAQAERVAAIREAVDRLPPAQREVITLRDIVGFGAAEVCEALCLTEGNQRVLLHRARSRVRAAVEQRLDATEETT